MIPVSRANLQLRRLVAILFGALIAWPLMSAVIKDTAHADGYVNCTGPSQPDPAFGGDGVRYWGTARCTETIDLDSFRVNLSLYFEDVNWGPIPNTWRIVDQSHTGYSQWAPYNGSRYRERFEYCSDLWDDTKYKAKFRYHLDWEDNHESYGQVFSSARKLC